MHILEEERISGSIDRTEPTYDIYDLRTVQSSNSRRILATDGGMQRNAMQEDGVGGGSGYIR